ncbi:MAG: DMT family transporter [Planctomycetota bacterium]|nr:DMT family transporter [Planctomycetota bacterium]MDP7253233.1 DMT family transporter [Planctomycetota bacterium]
MPNRASAHWANTSSHGISRPSPSGNLLFIILNILLSSSFILGMRWNQLNDRDLLSVGAINYITGWLVSLILYLLPGNQAHSSPAILWGTVNGAGYFIAFFLLLGTMKWKGAAQATVFARLSILVPVSVGIIVWGETPNGAEWGGITLACVSLLLIGGGKNLIEEKLPPGAFVTISLFFLIAGCSRLAQEGFKHQAEENEQMAYLLAAFTVMGVCSAVMLMKRKVKPGWTECWTGVLIGIANSLQVLFILKALEGYPGYVVFPVASAGGLLMTTLFAVIWLKESLSARGLVGISVAVLAVVALQS